MEEILYIQEFYHYTIIFLVVCIIFSWLSYWDGVWKKFLIFSSLVFASFSVYYLGNRDSSIGVDTSNYKYTFYLYEHAESFVFRKDFLFDLLTYLFAKVTEFNYFLMFCAFVYVYGVWYGLRKIFGINLFLAFSIFIIYPYFFQMGINVMRSGMAASIFIVAVGLYYKNQNQWKVIALLMISLLIHLSMLLPLIVFLLTKKLIRNTSIVLSLWLFSILLGSLKINFLPAIVNQFVLLGERFGSYTQINEESNAWSNFIIFGIFPVIFGCYNIFIKKFKDPFYMRLINSYMLIHIPYIVLINSEFSLRLGYLAEFMMPILILYPFVYNPSIQMNLYRFKLSVLFFVIFIIKAYKILIV
ncbi:EpsG family protein [Riemerella anatipestifer]|nr:EpsG family protein [Riemerella anatipestifer]